MIRLILIRHCETELGKNRYTGSTNVPLSGLGLNHAELIAKYLKDKKINLNKIYSGSLKRAYDTAGAIANLYSLEVEKLSGLNEINFGSWEGLTFDEILSSDRENLEKYLETPSDFRFPGGETHRELKDRVLKSLDLILEKYLDSNKTILVAGHGGTNRVILSKALNLDLKDQFKLKQDAGCINVIDFFEDNAVVSLMNYTINSESLNSIKCVKECEKCKKENCYSF